MSLRIAPEQISLTFSSPLVTAVCQKSTASVCHCHRPRPSRAIWEAALQRTPKIGSERRRKYHKVWHTRTTHSSLRSHYCGANNVCIHMKCMTIVYSSKTFMGIFSGFKWGVSFLHPLSFQWWSRSSCMKSLELRMHITVLTVQYTVLSCASME